jgi:ZIP family zinc transporter
MLAILFTFFMFISTLVGGWFAIRHKDKLGRILGLTAGIIMGVLAFDILPEMFEIIGEFNIDPTWPMVALIVGFLGFHIIEKLVLLHHEHETQYGKHHHPQVGTLSALALGGHSLLDGIGIGLAFQVNAGVGAAVATALVAHKFADGLNTAGLMLANKNTVARTVRMVFLNALLPIVGALSTLLFQLPEQYLPYYLGFFAGFLLYIGASDILPQAHDEKSDRITIGLTIAGVVFMFLVTRFALHHA